MQNIAMSRVPSSFIEAVDPIDITIGRRLKFRRNFMGLTQESLARQIGVSFQQIQKYESGQNKISAGKLYHISKILEAPLTFFFEEDEPISPGKTGMSDQGQDDFNHEDLINKSESAHLLRAYYDISDKKKRKTALDMLKGLQS